jgi:multiple sugar transport system permease protein
MSRGVTRSLLLAAGGLIMLYPLIWMVGSSFKPASEIFTTGNPFPGAGSGLSGYVDGWNSLGIGFWRFFLNSFVICTLCILGNLISCSLAAYAFARMNFRLRRLMFALMLGTMMLPYHVLIVPQFILFRYLHMVNTILPLVIPKFLGVDSFFIFLMVQFMRALPRELDDAAKIDGCGHWRLYLRIVLPLCKPALATTAIFTFIFTYNDFLGPLIYLSDPSQFTVSLALRSFVDTGVSGTSNYTGLLAMSTLSLLPVIGFFIAFQKLLVEGIATTGIR